MTGAWVLGWLAIGSMVLSAGAPGRDVRVGLFRSAPPVVLAVSSEGAFRIDAGGRRVTSGPGAPVVVRAEGGRLVLSRLGRRLLEAREVRLDGSGAWRLAPSSGAARRVSGDLKIGVTRGRLDVVVHQDLEAYVTACTGDEMPPDWPMAALEAQAIAGRTYARASLGRHGSEGFDFCDLTHCQRYRGLTGGDRRVSAAVEHSRGAVLTYRGRPIEALWHAACGGWRAPNSLVFGGAARPYLPGGYDGAPGHAPWCRDAHLEAWRFETSRPRLESALRAAGWLRSAEPLVGLAVSDRTAGGYAAGVRVEGEFTRARSGYALWMALGPRFGWGDLKSPAFTVSRQGENYRFTGHGLGHGVGMCQWGARGQALAGRSAAEILAFYFPGARLTR